MTDSQGSTHIELIARGLIRADGHVLLCRDVKDGYYALPGGHVDPGEQATVALARELQEEAGLRSRVGGLMMICEVLFTGRDGPHHEVNLLFHVEHATMESDQEWAAPEPVPSREAHIAFEWIDPVRFTDLDIRPAVVKAWLMSDLPADAPDHPDWFSVRE